MPARVWARECTELDERHGMHVVCDCRYTLSTLNIQRLDTERVLRFQVRCLEVRP